MTGNGAPFFVGRVMKKVLVLHAHPTPCRSEVNLPMFRAVSEMDGVTAVDLYAEYPTFNIDIEREQRRLLEHDVIVFQFPLFWYSTPAILKEWQDLVLEYGFAYGRNGTALSGKHFFCAITAGGTEEAYQSDGFNHFTIRELLQPLEQMARLTSMTYLPPLALFGARTAGQDGRVDAHVELWRNLLGGLVNEDFDLAQATDTEHFGLYLNALLSGERA